MLKNTQREKPSAPVKRRSPPPRRRIVKPPADDLPLVHAPKQPSRFVYKAEVCDRIGVTYVSIWRWMQAGTFPASREVGGQVAWLAEEIENWIATRPTRKIKKAEDV
jgi:predicted DNA-binding transcriptional regulator AlpA